jgi:hypothetical protein
VDPHRLPHNQIGGGVLPVVVAAAAAFFLATLMFLVLFKNTLPSFILSGRPLLEDIAQGCNWLTLNVASGHKKCCNLSINHGGPRQADPDAVVGAWFWPTCGRMADAMGRDAWAGVGRGGGAQVGRRWGFVHLLYQMHLVAFLASSYFSMILCLLCMISCFKISGLTLQIPGMSERQSTLLFPFCYLTFFWNMGTIP